VPLGTAMSTPGWQLSQARRSHISEEIGPRAGHARAPLPPRPGPPITGGAACAQARARAITSFA